MTTGTPNFLVICTDQQHHRMMSCAGNPWVSTPAMDRIAARGVRFDRAYATNPVCVPSRFSLVTGRMPSAIGLRSNDTSHITDVMPDITESGLGHLLRRAGYETAFAGKQHLPRSTAEAYGFTVLTRDDRDECAAAAARYLREEHAAPFALMVHLVNPHDICYMAIQQSQADDHERKLVQTGGTAIATMNDACSLPAGMSDAEFYASTCPPLPANFEPQDEEPRAIQALVDRRPFRRRAREQWDEATWRLHRWTYKRLTEMVDAQIGGIVDALDERNLWADTVVVFTSDHGDHDAAHRLEHKTTFYDESARIPLIVAAPGGPQGVTDASHLTSNGLDLFATLADYAGSTERADARGRSLRPVIEGSTEAWRVDLPIESEIGRCVVTSSFKYARYDAAGDEEQLVDLDSDPGEMRNVVRDSAYAKTLAVGRAAWARHFPTERQGRR